MTTRERWIVYPLLFLSLGVALKDKVVPPIQEGNPWLQLRANVISCSALQIIGPEGKPAAVFTFDPNTKLGLVNTNLIKADEISGDKVFCKKMVVEGAEGKAAIVAGYNSNTNLGFIKAGEIVLKNAEGKLALVAGSDPKYHAGLLETYSPNGIPLVQLRANEFGGYVAAISNEEKIGVMGHAPKDFGLFVQLPKNGGLVPVCIWPGYLTRETKEATTPSKQLPNQPQGQKDSKTKEQAPPKEG